MLLTLTDILHSSRRQFNIDIGIGNARQPLKNEKQPGFPAARVRASTMAIPLDNDLVPDLLRIANVPYISGSDRRISNFNCLAINLLLVYHKLRPAFMFQIIDHDAEYRETAREILNKLVSRFPVDTYKQYVCCQGIIFSTEDISTEVQRYNDTHDDVVLGNILGYPCSGEREEAKYACSINTQEGLSVMANMAKNRRSVKRFRSFYIKLSCFVRENIGVPLYLDTYEI